MVLQEQMRRKVWGEFPAERVREAQTVRLVA